jgi:hypothetical protein
VIVRLVVMCGIVDRNCLHFLFIIQFNGSVIKDCFQVIKIQDEIHFRNHILA